MGPKENLGEVIYIYSKIGIQDLSRKPSLQEIYEGLDDIQFDLEMSFFCKHNKDIMA